MIMIMCSHNQNIQNETGGVHPSSGKRDAGRLSNCSLTTPHALRALDRSDRIRSNNDLKWFFSYCYLLPHAYLI